MTLWLHIVLTLSTVYGGSIVLAVPLLESTRGNRPAKTKMSCFEVHNYCDICKYLFQTVLLYILTQPQIYTPDSAIYSLWSQQQGALYMPYKTACGAFDPPTHYSIILENVEHCGGVPEQADTGIPLSAVP